MALYLDNCHFKVSRSEVKRSKLRRTYVLMIAVIPPVCGGSVIRDFLRYLVSKNTKTPTNLSRSNTHEIIPAIKKSDKDDSSYSLLLLSTFHRLVLIPEKFKQQQRFESSEPFYLRQRANQLAKDHQWFQNGCNRMDKTKRKFVLCTVIVLSFGITHNEVNKEQICCFASYFQISAIF